MLEYLVVASVTRVSNSEYCFSNGESRSCASDLMRLRAGISLQFFSYLWYVALCLIFISYGFCLTASLYSERGVGILKLLQT